MLKTFTLTFIVVIGNSMSLDGIANTINGELELGLNKIEEMAS